MKVQVYTMIVMWFVFIGSGCSLLELPEQRDSLLTGSSYWDGPAQNFTATHVLNYFQQLRTLSKEDIGVEVKRSAKAYAGMHRPVDGVQYFLAWLVSGTQPEQKNKMVEIFEELRENSTFMRPDVQELFFLIDTVSTSQMARQLLKPSADAVEKATAEKTVELTKKLEECTENSKKLASQIQKLKDIERILSDRKLNTE